MNAKIGKEVTCGSIGNYSLHKEHSENGTWTAPYGGKVNQIDQILIDKRQSSGLLDFRVHNSANADTSQQEYHTPEIKKEPSLSEKAPVLTKEMDGLMKNILEDFEPREVMKRSMMTQIKRIRKYNTRHKTAVEVKQSEHIRELLGECKDQADIDKVFDKPGNTGSYKDIVLSYEEVYKAMEKNEK
ncbi:hypothetical protein CWI38_0442p0020 [Hamiltosporidium tvaerminnensis]|uniref:Uncharacterized protein n=1 Tax=Hamiltosporidium tvaerminnensis TaxID=1176355 RepID=A0A4V2JXW7_9MICR|nr:hypothetical protein CWI38_0442p0020 [Hamiltosporidium tvaerminnensis]